MAPRKRVDKGKRPMSELYQEPERHVTRPRGLGIHISEPRSSLRQRAEEARVEPEPEPEGEARGQDRPGSSGVVRPTTDEEISQPQMAALMQMMVGVVQDMRQFMETQSQPRTSNDQAPSAIAAEQAQVPARRRMEEPEVEIADVRRRIQEERSDMRTFQEMRPPSYQGEIDYRVADKWVAKMEKIFEYLQCSEEQRVRYATFMLEGDAEEWWRTERDTLPGRGRDLTWAEFLDRFFHHYIPASERTRRAAEFASLVQGKLSVAEYDSQFRSLSRFVSWTQIDLREKARKFQEGLRPSIRGKVAPLRLEDYADILDTARTVEREDEEWAKAQERRRGVGLRRGGRMQGRGQRPTSEHRQIPICTICGKQHIGQCLAGRGVCFGCGQAGHRRMECPYRDRVCYECGQRGHLREYCPQTRAQARPPPRVQQQQIVRVPPPARGQRGRSPQYR